VPAVNRQSVLEIFERHRAAAGAPFEESNFLDYLIENPKHIGAVRNSFLGLRRYNAFIEEAQLLYNVCFSLADFNASYSVAAFVLRVSNLQASPRGSVTSLRNQQRGGFGWHAVVFGNLLGLCLASGLFSTAPAASYALALTITTADLLAIRAFARWRSYSKRLMLQLTHGYRNDA